MIKEIIKNLEELSDKSRSFDSDYKYNDEMVVPRVTRILQSMLNEEYIAQWANSLGFKRLGYKKTLQDAANNGTYTHNSIEYFLRNNKDVDLDTIPYISRDIVFNTYGSFKKWWNIINQSNNIEIIYIEQKLIYKYFAGTLDLLLKINSDYWLVDFKTSNHIGFKYHLQVAAYRYMLKELYNIDISGAIILQLNKNLISFKEHVLDFNKDIVLDHINKCELLFLSLVQAYYLRYDVEIEFQAISNIEKRKRV